MYRATKYTVDDPNGTPAGELQYYAAGNRWKHVDETGAVTALYDPTANVIHYYGAEHTVLDAAKSDGPATFEQLSETRTILGYECRALKVTAPDLEQLMFYCPALRVDPAGFPNHHAGHWTETLRATNGALNLWSDMRKPNWRLVSEAVRVERMEFDGEFWAVPEHRD